ncbi:MAG: hypothetical protein NZM25_06025 [Leptospiraceae bacterium]|nr:hypothetical protein [Leptospiraceae bacterium]MDW8306667.1 hypothetical protein [Leptospiraceae bacterium]
MPPMVERLRGLFQSPVREWEIIKQEYLPSLLGLLRRYHIPVGLLLIVSFFLATWIRHGLSRHLLTQGLVAPLLLFLFFILALYILGLIAEEATELLGNIAPPKSGMKLTFFAAYPLAYALIFLPIPYMGGFLVILCLFYFFHLMASGAEHLYGIAGKRRFFWIATVIIASLLVFFLTSTLFLILSFLVNLIF